MLNERIILLLFVALINLNNTEAQLQENPQRVGLRVTQGFLLNAFDCRNCLNVMTSNTSQTRLTFDYRLRSKWSVLFDVKHLWQAGTFTGISTWFLPNSLYTDRQIIFSDYSFTATGVSAGLQYNWREGERGEWYMGITSGLLLTKASRYTRTGLQEPSTRNYGVKPGFTYGMNIGYTYWPIRKIGFTANVSIEDHGIFAVGFQVGNDVKPNKRVISFIQLGSIFRL